MAYELLLILGLATIVILLFSFVHNTNQSHKIMKGPENLPPGKSRWPIIGETLSFLSRPEEFIRERMMKYSSHVFKTSLLGERMAVFCGPAANKFVFSNEGELVKLWLPRSDLLSHPDIDPNSPSWERAQELSFKFLRLKSLLRYVGVVDSMAREHFDTLWATAPFKEVRVHPLAKEFTFNVACQLFIKKCCHDSVMSPQKVRELAQPFSLLREGMISAPINLPWTCYHKAIKGGDLVIQQLVDIIKQRKREIMRSVGTCPHKGCQHHDLLGRVLMSFTEDGNFANDKDIAITIAGFLLASSHAPSNAITSVIGYLADQPHVYEKVLQEQLEIKRCKGPKELIALEDIQKMKYTWNTVCESLRLTAPGQGGGFREAITDFNYEGFNIPKGWKIYWTVHSTHKDPKCFPNPDRFDPTRFEGAGPLPYTFVPFGGGPHTCPGREYTRIEMLIFIHNLVTRFRVEKVNPNEKIIYEPAPIPVDGLRIRLKPHE